MLLRSTGLPRQRAQAGYVLLEALVAVVIAAVGFIGAARLQTFGLAMNNSAQVRQKAILLGYDMADWQTEIAAQLPAGVGVVCIDSTPDDGTSAAPQCDGIGTVIAVKLWW